MPSSRTHFQFFLIRYVPDPVKEEFVNIGLVVFDPAKSECEVRFTRDWKRVHRLDPQADIRMLRAFELELRERLATRGEHRSRMLELLRDRFGNVLQLASVKTCVAESAMQEADRLAKMYLE